MRNIDKVYERMETAEDNLKNCNTTREQEFIIYSNALWTSAQMIAVVADELQEQNKLLKRLIDAVGKRR